MKTQYTLNENQFIPILTLKNTVIFPEVTLPILITKKLAINSILEASKNDGLIFVVALKNPDLIENPDSEFQDENLYRTGTLCLISKIEEKDNGDKLVFVEALDRFSAIEYRFNHEKKFIEVSGKPVFDEIDLNEETEKILLKNLKDLAQEILLQLNASREVQKILESFESVAIFTHVAIQNLPLAVAKKQEVLEITSIKNRALKVLELLVEQKEFIKVNAEVGALVSKKTNKAYRESILREQMRAIQEELGDEEKDEDGKTKTLKERILDAKMPKDVEKIALENAKRLETMGGQNAEANVLRNYVELLIVLPWNVKEELNIDLDFAKKTLDHDHFGLEKVKKHIIQYLAVKKLTPKTNGQILLLVGPPGVGKTSLGNSIATALKKKYVRVALGGLRDDAEIRGHRRTYVGALPGKIIDGIKRAGEMDPVFVLDEIDKLSRSITGDPASTLLEVLDPEQNKTFHDHYLDVPYDLSKVTFIATANNLENIPLPLLDRMEVIQLSSYTIKEKLNIAMNFLLPKSQKELGMEKIDIHFSKNAMTYLIESYTKEAGVRDLKRKIQRLLKDEVENVVNGTTNILIDEQKIDQCLDSHKFKKEKVLHEMNPGVVTGLAWTPVGGDILYIESVMMPGTGKVQLTGQLGDVMSESAHIALSLVRSKLSTAVSGLDFSKWDFHIHVPSGSTPKDGPSAGITLFTALCSLVLNKPIDSKLAMTGEITLRGAVLPVGGIKEKIIAAHASGIKKVIMCKENERDLKEVDSEVKNQMEFFFVENIHELLNIVFGKFNLNLNLNSSLNSPKIFSLPDQTATN